jgi:hypothetical protein
MGQGKLIIHPPGTPLPPNHPFAQPRIIFGVKRPGSMEVNSTEPDQTKDTSAAGTSDPAIDASTSLSHQEPKV